MCNNNQTENSSNCNAQLETHMMEHFQDVVKGEETPHDEFERHLAEATIIRNKVVDGKSENLSDDLDEAFQHLDEARKHLPASDLRDCFCDILDSLQIEFNQFKEQ